MAGQECSVCAHPDRASVETDRLTKQGSLRNIAERYGVSTTALHRHMAKCVDSATKTALAVVEARSEARLTASVAHSAQLVIETRSEVRDALERVKRVADALERMADSPEAMTDGPERRALLSEAGKMVKVINDTLRLHAQLTGELSPASTNVLVINSVDDFLKAPGQQAETARAQQEVFFYGLTAYQERLAGLDTVEGCAATWDEFHMRMTAKATEMGGGRSGRR